MGQPKLLLPWPTASLPENARQTSESQRGMSAEQRGMSAEQRGLSAELGSRHPRVIDQVLGTWTRSCVTETIVVARGDDELLIAACEPWPVHLLRLDQETPDMKASVQVGLRYVAQQFAPDETDRCFIAPGDLPLLTTEIVNRLASTTKEVVQPIIPCFGGRRGHPALFPWLLTQEIFHLAPQEGINRIVARNPTHRVEFPAHAMVKDMDTPEEYEAALKRCQPS